MKAKFKLNWDGEYYDWILLPTFLFACRKPYYYDEYGFGIGIGLLFLKWKIQFFILLNRKP